MDAAHPVNTQLLGGVDICHAIHSNYSVKISVVTVYNCIILIHTIPLKT